MSNSPVVIITGAASGIGNHFSRVLLQRDYRLVLCDINNDGLTAAFADPAITTMTNPARVRLHQLDVTDPAQWAQVIDETVAEFGRIDYLFNIAGIMRPGYVHEINLDEVDRHIDINVKGVMYGTKLAARQMVKQGEGHIINVASLAGVAPIPGNSLYSASKFAVRGYSLAAAQELRARGVYVTVVSPDLVDTPMLDLQLGYEEAALTFSGSGSLTVEDVEAAFFKAMRNRPQEILLPQGRGILAKAASVAPALNRLLNPSLIQKGNRAMSQLRRQRGHDFDGARQAPRICIIGAGVSGITMGKALAARGIAYDCYEKGSVIGGNWAFKNPNGLSAAYRSLHIDTSKARLEFDDYPMPADYPSFPGHAQINDYFNDIVDHFDLRRQITFNTSVKHAHLRHDDQWEITLKDEPTGEEELQLYDMLIVANGHHWAKNYPDFSGNFDGDELHAHDYIDPFEPLNMRGKRVLVVGIGNSAADIASELANPTIAAKVTLSTRRGAHVLPKFVFGRPLDQVAPTIPWLPLGIQRRAAGLLMRLAVGRVEDYGLPTPDHRVLEAHPTVSSDLLGRVGNGEIVVKPDVAELQGDRVKFVDGSVEEFDVILYATGYNIEFPFFDEEFLAAPNNQFPLFKRTIVPGMDNLIFIGFAQVIPSIIKFVQVQAEWMAAYLAEEYVLPPVAEMEAAIDHDQKLHAGHYVHSQRHTMQTDYYVYKWDMAKELARGRARAEAAGLVPPSEPQRGPSWKLAGGVALGITAAIWLTRHKG